MAAPNKRLNSKVLIVGNNRDALSAMSNLLEKQKFSVSTAQNGWQAFNRLQVDDHISLVVLLDLSMPVDGSDRNFCACKRSDSRIAERYP